MNWSLRPYTPPDFTEERFIRAPEAQLMPAPMDGVAPDRFHAMSIYPEYFRIDGAWQRRAAWTACRYGRTDGSSSGSSAC